MCVSANVMLNSRFYVLDEGNCSPHFKRMSTYTVACTADQQTESGLPLSFLFRPLAPTLPMEVGITIVLSKCQ